jgi:hypothetical protein
LLLFRRLPKVFLFFWWCCRVTICRTPAFSSPLFRPSEFQCGSERDRDSERRKQA